jgi:uncharacterized Zn finger protein
MKAPKIKVVHHKTGTFRGGQIYDGEPIIVRGYHVIRCCDCGKVHLVRIQHRNRQSFKLTVWSDKKLTAARRRAKRYKHVRGVKWPK